MWLKYAMSIERYTAGSFGLEMAMLIEKNFPDIVEAAWLIGSPAMKLTTQDYTEDTPYTKDQEEEVKDIDVFIKLNKPWSRIKLDKRKKFLEYISARVVDFGTNLHAMRYPYQYNYADPGPSWDIFIQDTKRRLMRFDPVGMLEELTDYDFNVPKALNHYDVDYDVIESPILYDISRDAPYTPTYPYGWKMIGRRYERKIDPETGDTRLILTEPKEVYHHRINKRPWEEFSTYEKDPSSFRGRDASEILEQISKRSLLYGLSPEETRRKQITFLRQAIKNNWGLINAEDVYMDLVD